MRCRPTKAGGIAGGDCAQHCVGEVGRRNPRGGSLPGAPSRGGSATHENSKAKPPFFRTHLLDTLASGNRLRPPMSLPMAQPVQQAQPAMMKMAVTVPQGMMGGQPLQVQTPSGLMQVTIPQGLQGGQTFEMMVPTQQQQQPPMAQAQPMMQQQQQQPMYQQQQPMMQQQQPMYQQQPQVMYQQQPQVIVQQQPQVIVQQPPVIIGGGYGYGYGYGPDPGLAMAGGLVGGMMIGGMMDEVFD
jgi:hypothetical protein